jgi:hypothetical protein
MAAARKCRLIGMAFGVLAILLMASSTLQAAAWLPGSAPDWNQPYDYTPVTIPGGGPGGWPPGPAGPWVAWCAPSSASNVVGYWEDARGSQIADGQVFPATVNWSTSPSWHDYNADGFSRPPVNGATGGVTTDIGWYMDTDRTGKNRGDAPHAGTKIKNLHIGLADYLADRAPGWLQSVPLGAVKTEGRAGAGVAYTTNPANPAIPHVNPASAFLQITQEINANRPLVISWTSWNLQNTGVQLAGVGGPSQESSFGGDYYKWLTYGGWGNPDPGGHGEVWNGDYNGDGLGHATTAVGYIAAGSPDDAWAQCNLGGPTDWVIVHDNWASTARNVIVPFDAGIFANWAANTTMIPEPCGWIMILTGGFAYWLISQRRRKTA